MAVDNFSLQSLGMPVEYAALKDAIAWAQRSVVVYGKTFPQPRLTRWYGTVPYVYSGLRWEAAPMPDLIARICARIRNVTGEPFNSVLCNLYRDGYDCVGWHADDEVIFGQEPVVASASFGATRTFKIRRSDKSDVRSFDLVDGSLFVMGMGMQATHEHCIPRTAKPCGERINLTFRRTVSIAEVAQ